MKQIILLSFFLILPSCSSLRKTDTILFYSKPDLKTLSEATLKIYEQNCLEKKDVFYCSLLGSYEYDQQNKAKAKKYFHISCTKNDTSSCELEDIFTYEETKDTKIKEHYKNLCSQNKPNSCLTLASLEGADGHTEEATRLRKKLCNEGVSKACLALGMKYDGVNYDEALKYYDLTCEYKDAFTCMLLGFSFEQKHKTELSYKYLKKACLLQDSAACFHLAQKYADENDYSSAYQFHLENCKLKNRLSCLWIKIYDKNDSYGIQKSIFQKSCDKGENRDCKFLQYINSRDK